MCFSAATANLLNWRKATRSDTKETDKAGRDLKPKGEMTSQSIWTFDERVQPRSVGGIFSLSYSEERRKWCKAIIRV